jgi:hypothetical protein
MEALHSGVNSAGLVGVDAALSALVEQDLGCLSDADLLASVRERERLARQLTAAGIGQVAEAAAAWVGGAVGSGVEQGSAGVDAADLEFRRGGSGRCGAGGVCAGRRWTFHRQVRASGSTDRRTPCAAYRASGRSVMVKAKYERRSDDGSFVLLG